MKTHHCCGVARVKTENERSGIASSNNCFHLQNFGQPPGEIIWTERTERYALHSFWQTDDDQRWNDDLASVEYLTPDWSNADK